MGVVFKARQVDLDRVVALKMVRSGEAAGAEELARFRTEGQAVARLGHPNVIQVYTFGEHDGQLYFVMELAEGGSLARKLKAGPLPLREAAELVAALARGGQAAHDAHVIHRDLKPAHVLL